MHRKKLYHIGVVLATALSLVCSACSGGDDIAGNDGGGTNKKEETKDDKPTPDAGNDLYGLVTDGDGKAIADVVVSDGYQCVTTNAQGFYQMKRSANAEFVAYSIPSGYKAKSNQFYKKLSADTKEYDFTLEKLSDTENHFYLISIADPQVTNNSEIARYQNETMPDLKETIAGMNLPVYGICLGDVVNNKVEHLKTMQNLLNSTDMPVFTTIGNHDKDTPTDTSKPRTTKTFTNVFGPLNYSFNRGKVHFICMDNVVFTTAEDYSACFSDEQVEWMRQDLQYVPKDRLIIFYYHIPLRDSDVPNRDAILSLLKDYPNVKLMCGHTHYNQNYPITSPISVEERVTGAACGAWWRGVVCADGTPNGYEVYEINGSQIVDNYYKSTRFDRAYQMRLHRGSDSFGGEYANYSYQLDDDYVVANVWNYDASWHVSIYEDGVYQGEMTQKTYKPDAWAGGYFIGTLNRTSSVYNPQTKHIFVHKLSNPNAQVKVVATDGFGNTYEQTEFVSDLTTAGEYAAQ